MLDGNEFEEDRYDAGSNLESFEPFDDLHRKDLANQR